MMGESRQEKASEIKLNYYDQNHPQTTTRKYLAENRIGMPQQIRGCSKSTSDPSTADETQGCLMAHRNDPHPMPLSSLAHQGANTLSSPTVDDTAAASGRP